MGAKTFTFPQMDYVRPDFEKIGGEGRRTDVPGT